MQQPNLIPLLKQCSEEQLIDINKIVVELIKLKRQTKTVLALNSFKPGSRVKWMSPRFNREMLGTVVKVKRKMIDVKLDDFAGSGTWSVEAALLQNA